MEFAMDRDQILRALDDLEKRVQRLEKWQSPKMINDGKCLRSMPYCACGRDVCRAPDCPSHRRDFDPLGR